MNLRFRTLLVAAQNTLWYIYTIYYIAIFQILFLAGPPLPAVVWPVDLSPPVTRSPRTSSSRNGTDAEKSPKRYGNATRKWQPSCFCMLSSFPMDFTVSRGESSSPRETGGTRIAYKIANENTRSNTLPLCNSIDSFQ